MLLEKVDQNSPKFLEICYVPIPLIVPNFIVLGQTMNEKSATNFFYALQYFGAPRGPLGQSSSVAALMYRKDRTTKVPNVPF